MNTTQRGYGAAHQRERARLKPTIDAGNGWCTQPVCIERTRWIEPGTPWALGHTDDRTAWLGPVHHSCNQRDGASKGGRVIAARRHNHITNHRTPRPSSRNWLGQ